jgi:hypothetical protein
MEHRRISIARLGNAPKEDAIETKAAILAIFCGLILAQAAGMK